MTRNLTAAITSGAFANKGESVVVLGEDLATLPVCLSIADACRNVGRLVYELDGENTMANVAFDSPMVTSDLLIVRQLPKDGEHLVGLGTAPSASKALGAVLFRRAEIGKSTLIATSEVPCDWVTHNRLGPDTFWIAASLGIGLLLDSEKAEQHSTHVPADHRYRNIFDKHSVVPMECVVDHVLLAEFDRAMYRPDWHWVDYGTS